MAIQETPRFANLMGLRVGGDVAGITYYVNKQGKLVFFTKAPPTCPPTAKQIFNRNTFRLVAMAWRQRTDSQRAAWELLTRRASLCMNGYNLSVHFQMNVDQAALKTLQSQTGVTVT